MTSLLWPDLLIFGAVFVLVFVCWFVTAAFRALFDKSKRQWRRQWGAPNAHRLSELSETLRRKRAIR